MTESWELVVEVHMLSVSFQFLVVRECSAFFAHSFCTAAARALVDIDDLSAEEVATKAMKVASNMCVYTNDTYLKELMDTTEEEQGED